MKPAGKRTRAHKKACRRYIVAFLKEHGCLFCESANCDDPNKAFPPHSTHHIFSAGRYPSHPELHNKLNLILLCHKCHSEFEEHKRKEEHVQLTKERGLIKLFN